MSNYSGMTKVELIERLKFVEAASTSRGHVRLIEKHPQRAGLHNTVLRFECGQGILDFLFRRGPAPKRTPKVDGIEVVRQIKADAELRKLPVSMLTTTDDPREMVRCHELSRSNYIVKLLDYAKFSEVIKQLGLFISLVQGPEINGRPAG